jgi:hypothetical protein
VDQDIIAIFLEVIVRCCVSVAMDERENGKEVGNVGSKRENVTSEV